MTVRIVGHSSFIGSHLPYDQVVDWNGKPVRYLAPSYEQMDGIFWGKKDDVLINCVGRCGNPNVDQCESIREETNESNTLIPIMLANLCNQQGIRFIHVGSGCIFSGPSPHVNMDLTKNGWEITGKLNREEGWNELDYATPLLYYSKTKYAADLAIADLPNTTILRVRMPISSKHAPRNFIDKVSKYKKVIDIPNSLTFLDDLVKCIAWVIETDKRGIWNVVNPGPLSAADIMREYQKHEPDHTFDIMTGSELDAITTAKRSNCILDGSKLKAAGFEMTPSQEALEETMTKYFEGATE